MLRAAIGKIRRWLLQESEEPRRVPGTTEPEIVVYHWDGSPPEGRDLRDISEKAAHIYTSERGYPGTIVRVILQAFPGAAHEDATTAPTPSKCIPARVMRQCNDAARVNNFETLRNEV